MNLQLDENDARMLRDLLRQKVVEMDTEINRTDSLTFKEDLRRLEQGLERIIGALSTALDAPGRDSTPPR